MKDLHTFGWYASRITKHLPKNAFKPAPTRLFGGLAYLTVTITTILAIGLFQLPLLINVLLSLILGFCFAG